MPAAILAIIEVCGAFFSRLVASRIGQWLMQALLFFGIQFVSQKFVSGPLSSGLAAYFSGVPADIIQWLRYTNIDRALTVILSAYATVSATHWAITRKPTA